MRSLNVNLPKSIAKFESAMKRKFLVKTVFYEKVFRGKGLEFESYRAYSPDDDASRIDWKATMRAKKPIVRQYIEERDLKIFFLVDTSDNMVFGSGDKLKNELAAEIAASLAHLVSSLGDRIGFALYSNKIVSMKLPSKGIRQFYIFSKNLLNSRNYGGSPDLSNALKKTFSYLKENSTIFLISDFLKIDSESEKILKEISKKHELIGIMIRDPVDLNLPDINREIVIEDVDTGRQLLINPHLIRKKYEKNAFMQKKHVESIFKKTGSDLITIHTDKDFIKPLADFLRSRIKRREYILPKR